MFQNIKSTYSQNKTSSIITSLSALGGLVYSIKKQKSFLGIIGYTLIGAFGGMLLSTAINKANN